MLVGLILAVGIAGTVVALKSHESNAEFVLQQQSLTPVQPAALQTLLADQQGLPPGYTQAAPGPRIAQRLRTARSATPGVVSCATRVPRACAST